MTSIVVSVRLSVDHMAHLLAALQEDGVEPANLSQVVRQATAGYLRFLVRCPAGTRVPTKTRPSRKNIARL